MVNLPHTQWSWSQRCQHSRPHRCALWCPFSRSRALTAAGGCCCAIRLQEQPSIGFIETLHRAPTPHLREHHPSYGLCVVSCFRRFCSWCCFARLSRLFVCVLTAREATAESKPHWTLSERDSTKPPPDPRASSLPRTDANEAKPLRDTRCFRTRRPLSSSDAMSDAPAKPAAAATPAPAATAAAGTAAPAGAAAPAAAAAAVKQFTGYHSFMVNACKFTVDAKYQPLKPLGRGAYGVVWSQHSTAHSAGAETRQRVESGEIRGRKQAEIRTRRLGSLSARAWRGCASLPLLFRCVQLCQRQSVRSQGT